MISSFIRTFLPVLLFASLASLAAAEGVTGKLNNQPWVATTAEINERIPAEAGIWSVKVSAGKDAPALNLRIPSKIGVYPLEAHNERTGI